MTKPEMPSTPSSSVIRHSAFGILALALAWLGYHLAAPPPPPASLASRPVPPTTTQTDPVEVFQKAFWKRPTENDKILHAERREWQGKDGLSKWQWFIAVQPSPELVKYLRNDNAFNLVPGTAPASTSDVPAWFAFKPEAVNTLQSPQGNLRLVFSQPDNMLYASDSGGGFKPGAHEPGKPFPKTVTNGRLPTTSPPKP